MKTTGESGKKKITKGRKIVGDILLFLCVAIMVYLIVMVVCRLSMASDEKKWLLVLHFLSELGTLCLLSFPAVDIRFGIFSWKKNRLFKIAGMLLRTVSCAFCAIFIVLSTAIVITGAIEDDKPVENVCVLGLAIDGDELPPDLIHRLDQALEYSEANADIRLIVTGGNGRIPECSEAAYMARYLVENGLDHGSELIAETNAKTTVENFEYVAELVEKGEPLGVITNNFHMFRATRIAKKQGYKTIIKIPAKSEPLSYCENVFWEAICSVVETCRGNMAY